MTACSRATRTASRWPSTRPTRRASPTRRGVDIAPALVGDVHAARRPQRAAGLPAARRALSRRRLRARRGRRALTGIPAATIRRIAAELAHAAFEQPIDARQPWTDWAGRRHDKTVGRPVAMHAMRGISAHSNGFQTCRACCICCRSCSARSMCPAASATRRRIPRPTPPAASRPASAGDRARARRCRARRSAFRTGPEDLLVDADGTPLRIDKAFSWDAPLAAHGLMHMVITNAARGDPYPIDTLFMYMANMAGTRR